MSGGSVQLRSCRIARRDGATIATACVLSGISLAEARLIEADDAKHPPPLEAFEPLIPAPTQAPHPKEDDMARPKKQEHVEEVRTPDYQLAVRIWRNDIKPALAKSGEYAQEQSTAYKAIKKSANIQPQAAKLAFKLDGMEESKRDDFLRSLNGLLKALNIFMPLDLVDAAEGKGTTTDSVVPMGQRPKPQLATVPKGPAGDQDLVDAADDLPHAAE
ncbi:hypothetical protein [Sphingomonas sp.]|uniref:hypothetical protein n=1 Tax=Sphingomonas sp. TaxID=28214 RepID=UPI0035C7C064